MMPPGHAHLQDTTESNNNSNNSNNDKDHEQKVSQS